PTDGSVPSLDRRCTIPPGSGAVAGPRGRVLASAPGRQGALKTILRIVVGAVNPLWLHFFARAGILPISFTFSPALRSSRPTLPSLLVSARPNVTRTFLTLYSVVLPWSPAA